MKRKHSFDRFELDDDLSNEKVDPVSAIEHSTAVGDGDGELPLELEPAKTEFLGKT